MTFTNDVEVTRELYIKPLKWDNNISGLYSVRPITSLKDCD